MFLNFHCEFLDLFEFGNELLMQGPADQPLQGLHQHDEDENHHALGDRRRQNIVSLQPATQSAHEIQVDQKSKNGRDGIDDIPLNAQVEKVVAKNGVTHQAAGKNSHQHQTCGEVSSQPAHRRQDVRQIGNRPTQCQQSLKPREIPVKSRECRVNIATMHIQVHVDARGEEQGGYGPKNQQAHRGAERHQRLQAQVTQQPAHNPRTEHHGKIKARHQQPLPRPDRDEAGAILRLHVNQQGHGGDEPHDGNGTGESG